MEEIGLHVQRSTSTRTSRGWPSQLVTPVIHPQGLTFEETSQDLSSAQTQLEVHLLVISSSLQAPLDR